MGPFGAGLRGLLQGFQAIRPGTAADVLRDCGHSPRADRRAAQLTRLTGVTAEVHTGELLLSGIGGSDEHRRTEAGPSFFAPSRPPPHLDGARPRSEVTGVPNQAVRKGENWKLPPAAACPSARLIQGLESAAGRTVMRDAWRNDLITDDRSL